MTCLPGEIRQKPTPSASRPTTNGRPPFALVTLLPDGGPLLSALRQGLVEASDAALVIALQQRFEWRACRCWADWSDLAASTGMPEEAVRAAAERLMQAKLLAVGRHSENPSWAYWAVHPDLASDGRTTELAERRRWAQWAELLAAGARMDDRVSGSRLRYLKQLARKREQKAAARAAAERSARVLVAALAPEAPADRPAPARGVQRPPAAAAPAGGGGAGGGRQPEPAEQTIRRQGLLSEIGSRARVVDLRPTPEQRAAEAEWQAQADERRRARSAA